MHEVMDYTFDLSRLPFSRKGTLLLLQDGGAGKGVFLSAASYYRYLGLMGNLCHVRPAAGDYTTEATPARVIIKGAQCTFRVTFHDDQAFAFETNGAVRFDFDAKEQGILNVVERPGQRIDVTASRGEHYIQFHLDDSVSVATRCDYRADGNQFYPRTITLMIRPRVGVTTGRFLVSLSTTELTTKTPGPFAAAERRCGEAWLAWLHSAPEVDAPYRETYLTCLYSLYTNILPPHGSITRFGCTPSKGHFHGMFLYDACFASLGLRHVDRTLARDQVLILFDRQLPSGMVPDITHSQGEKCTATKPPIESWTALKHLSPRPDAAELEFIRGLYPRAAKWNEWWRRERDYDQDGIAQDNHFWDSGWDNSPVFDEGTPIEAADLNAHLVIQMQALAQMARLLGKPDDAEAWENKAAHLLAALLSHSWDAPTGRFRSGKSGSHARVDTNSMIDLMPLLLGPQLPADVRAALVKNLRDPAAFWGRWSLPTVAYNDPHYEKGCYWRGPVWVNVNYFMIEALERCGERAFARELRDKTLDLVAKDTAPYEHYDSQTGEGLGAAGFSWTAALFIDLAVKKARGKIVLE